MTGHIRGDNYSPTTTVVWNPAILSKIESYKKSEDKDNRSQAINELVLYGLKYKELLEKKKAKRMLS